MKQSPSKGQRRALRRCAFLMVLLVCLLILSIDITFTPAAALRQAERYYSLTETEILDRQELGRQKLLIFSASEDAVMLNLLRWEFPHGWRSISAVLDYPPGRPYYTDAGTIYLTNRTTGEATLYIYGRIDAATADGMHISIQAQKIIDENDEALSTFEWDDPYLYQDFDLRKRDILLQDGYLYFYTALPMTYQFMHTHSFEITITPLRGGEPSGIPVEPDSSLLADWR